jgi:integrase
MMSKLPHNKIGWSIRIMLGTGIRPQEPLALEPKHIAEDGSSITIEQAVVMDKATAELRIHIQSL